MFFIASYSPSDILLIRYIPRNVHSSFVGVPLRCEFCLVYFLSDNLLSISINFPIADENNQSIYLTGDRSYKQTTSCVRSECLASHYLYPVSWGSQPQQAVAIAF